MWFNAEKYKITHREGSSWKGAEVEDWCYHIQEEQDRDGRSRSAKGETTTQNLCEDAVCPDLRIYHRVKEHKQHLWLLFLPALQLGKHKASFAKRDDSFYHHLSRLPLSSPRHTASPGWDGIAATLAFSWASNEVFQQKYMPASFYILSLTES